MFRIFQALTERPDLLPLVEGGLYLVRIGRGLEFLDFSEEPLDLREAGLFVAAERPIELCFCSRFRLTGWSSEPLSHQANYKGQRLLVLFQSLLGNELLGTTYANGTVVFVVDYVELKSVAANLLIVVVKETPDCCAFLVKVSR